MRFRFLIAVFAALSMVVPARAFDFSDARRVIAYSQPQISPDGSRVVYLRGTMDFENDRVDRQLWLVNVRTHDARELTYGRHGLDSPSWSRDGRAVAFVADDGNGKDAQSQIFVLPLDGGEARQITHAKNGVTSYAWSPDNRHFAYTMQDDDANPNADETHLDAFQVADNDYLHRAPTPPTHVWMVDADGAHARRMTSGSWSVALDPDGGGDLSWSGNAKSVAFEHFPTPYIGDSMPSYIGILDVADGRSHPLSAGERMQQSAIYAPAGNEIAYFRPANGDATLGNDVYVADGTGRRIADLRSALDRSVEGAAWANADALWIYALDGTDHALWYWTPGKSAHRAALGAIQPLALGNASKSGALTFIGSTISAPGEVYLLADASSRPVALTDGNTFAMHAGVARTVGVSWHATKGSFLEDGIVTYPLHARAGKTPLILLIHGGPQSASTVAWSSQAQIYAARGYFVFQPNYRGSTNLGDAYQHAITNDAGDGPGKDVMAGLAYVEAHFPIDTNDVGVSGWSYGGYMTSWLIGNYPNVWKVAVSGASLDDWLDDYDIAFYYDTDVPYFRGKPWNPKNTPEWREQSPIAYAQHAKAPTLIMGDFGDNNVTITNSFKLYHALKDNGTTVKFFAYPVAGHFPSDPVRSEDVSKHWIDWLSEYLK